MSSWHQTADTADGTSAGEYRPSAGEYASCSYQDRK